MQRYALRRVLCRESVMHGAMVTKPSAMRLLQVFEAMFLCGSVPCHWYVVAHSVVCSGSCLAGLRGFCCVFVFSFLVFEYPTTLLESRCQC